MKRTRKTKMEIEEIISDYQTDHDLNRVAAKFGLLKDSLRVTLHNHGVYKSGVIKRQPGKRSLPRTKFGLRLAQNIWFHLSDHPTGDSEIAEHLGITQNRLSMIKSGYHIPNAFELMKLAELCKVPMDVFFDQQLKELTNASQS